MTQCSSSKFSQSRMTTRSVRMHSEERIGVFKVAGRPDQNQKTSKYIHTNSVFESQVPSTKMRYLPTIAAGLLALSSSTSAAPTSQEPSSPNSELIRPSDFELISFYSQLAAASYCPSNIDGGSSILSCSAGNCDAVQDRSFRTTLKFPS